MMDGGKGFEDAQTGEQKIRNFNILSLIHI